MKTGFIKAATVLLGLLLACSANAQSASARAQLERFSAGLETLHARFEQQVIGNDGAVQDASGGEVWLQRPDRFRWEYGGDFPEQVVADSRNIWIYDITLEQVTVKQQSQAGLDSPLVLLTDPERLDEQFEVREAGNDDSLLLLELRAKDAEVEFERILLGLKDDRIVLMIVEDAFGLRTELRFRDVSRNPEIDPGRFVFELPEGVDLIGEPVVP
jgi:outer membrane lipoprotein carrier protein